MGNYSCLKKDIMFIVMLTNQSDVGTYLKQGKFKDQVFILSLHSFVKLLTWFGSVDLILKVFC